MENTFKKALSQIKADDNLKKRTAEYILNTDSNVVSINAAADLKKKPFYGKKLVAAACIAAVLCALPIGAYAYYQTPTSYVSVDINPSVELGINAFGKVVSVKAFNTDGETVIAGLELLNSNVESAVKHIVKSASQNGFIKDDGSSFISVTAETNNEKKAEKLKTAAMAGAEDAIESENDSATIETDDIGLDRRDEAIALDITPGKLNLIQKLQELDPTIKTDDFKDSSVSEIQKKFTELKKEHNGKDESSEPASQSPGESPSESPSPVSPSNTNGNNKPDDHSNGNNGNGSNKHDDDTDTSGNDADSSPSSTPPNENSNNNSNHGNGNGNSGKDGR